MMHEYSCADVRERLEAFHDGELPIDERVAIQSHLGDCVACSLAAGELTDDRRDAARVGRAGGRRAAAPSRCA